MKITYCKVLNGPWLNYNFYGQNVLATATFV